VILLPAAGDIVVNRLFHAKFHPRRFCTAHSCARHTDTQTTLRATYVATSRTACGRCGQIMTVAMCQSSETSRHGVTSTALFAGKIDCDNYCGVGRAVKRSRVRLAVRILHGVTFLCSYLSTRRCRSSFNATRKNASAVCRQRTVRRTTGVIVSRFQSFFCCWSTSVESATYINSSNGLYRDVQAPSKN